MLLYFIKNKVYIFHISMLLLLSHFSRVRLWVTPLTAAHQVPPSLGFSRQEHWIGLPFPSPMQESENCKWSRSVVSNSLWPHGLQPTKLLRPWDFPGKSMEWVAIAFSIHISIVSSVPQLCPTLCNPMDCILPSSSVHGIFQARVLEWIAISFSRGSSQPRDQTLVSCIANRFFITWAIGKSCEQHFAHSK